MGGVFCRCPAKSRLSLRTDFSLKCTVYNRYLNKSWLERGKKGRKSRESTEIREKGLLCYAFSKQGGERFYTGPGFFNY